MLARWRDSMMFLQSIEMDNMLNLLTKIAISDEVSSHERIYTAVHLYNTGYLHMCYDCFRFIASSNLVLIEHRLEAIRFLFATEDERPIAKKFY